MIDLRVAQPTLAEVADGGRSSRDEREGGQNSIQSIQYTASLTQVVIFTPCVARLRDIIHRTEVNYSEVKLYFAED